MKLLLVISPRERIKIRKNAYRIFPYTWAAGQFEAGLPKTVFTGAHQYLVEVLTKTRKAAKLTQTDVAERLGKDQTFVSLIERSQRRVDVLEFVALARAMGQDPVELFAKIVAKLPKRFDI